MPRACPRVPLGVRYRGFGQEHGPVGLAAGPRSNLKKAQRWMAAG